MCCFKILGTSILYLYLFIETHKVENALCFKDVNNLESPLVSAVFFVSVSVSISHQVSLLSSWLIWLSLSSQLTCVTLIIYDCKILFSCTHYTFVYDAMWLKTACFDVVVPLLLLAIVCMFEVFKVWSGLQRAIIFCWNLLPLLLQFSMFVLWFWAKQ